jgi:hypothetical protein
MGILQGLAGNLSEVSQEDLRSKYGKYLIEGENIELGFKLIRDVLIFTNLRIIDFNRQGTTGKKMRVESIHLDSIVQVRCETAGFGFDDGEIDIVYIDSPYYKANTIKLLAKKYEFPKKFDITPLYVRLESIAQQNLSRINS